MNWVTFALNRSNKAVFGHTFEDWNLENEISYRNNSIVTAQLG